MQKVAGTVPVVLYFTLTDDERFYDRRSKTFKMCSRFVVLNVKKNPQRFFLHKLHPVSSVILARAI